MAGRNRSIWRSIFSPVILQRGREYFKLGKAKKLANKEDHYTAVVRGSRNYNVEIYLDRLSGKVKHMSCTCPYAAEGAPCKHEAAMLYLMESEGIFNGIENNTEKQQEEDTKPAPGVIDSAEVYKKADDNDNIKHLLSPLHELETKEINKLAEKDTGEHAYATDDYRYFDVSKLLSQANPSAGTLKKAKDLFKKNQVGNLQLSISYNSLSSGNDEPVAEGCLTSSETAPALWSANIRFSKNKLIGGDCTSCIRYYDYKSPTMKYICEHQIAAIMAVQDFLKDKNIGDATNRQAARVIENISEGSNPDNEKAAALSAKIHIKPRLHTDGYSIKADFRINTDNTKPYKINSISSILKSFHHHEVKIFGKKTEMYLSDKLLDESSQKWYEFLQRRQDLTSEAENLIYDKLPDRFSYYADSINISTLGSFLNLTDSALDDFFDTAAAVGSPIDLEIRHPIENTNDQVTMQTSKPHLSFDIHPVYEGKKKVFTGVCMTGEMPDIIYGNKYAYVMTQKHLTRIEKDAKNIYSLLYDTMEGGQVNLMVGRNNLTEFYNNVVPEIEKIADISETDTEEIRKYLVPEAVFRFFLDVEGSLVLGSAHVTYDSKDYHLSDWIKDTYGSRIDAFRRSGKEQKVLQVFQRYLPNFDSGFNVFFCRKSDDELFNLLDHGLAELMDYGDVQVTDRFNRLKLKNRVPVKVGVMLKSGLLDLSINSEDLSPEELLDVLFSYKRKKNYIRLKNGDFLKLSDDDSLEALSSMMEEMNMSPKDFVKGHMQLPAYRALYLDRMLDRMSDVYEERDSHFKSLVRAFKSVEDSDYEVPQGIKAKLRKYQKEGYRWLRTLDEWHFGGILADEMGLGKTLQTIAVFEAEKGSGSSIVICPASLVYNWGEELAKFAPDLSVQLIAGTKPEREKSIASAADYDVNVTSYDLLKRDIDQYEGKEFRFAIVDEAQNLKNSGTAAAKSVKLVNAKSRFALTGTPIENRLSELWSIFDFIMPGYLYDYATFRENIELPASRENTDARERLSRMVAPFILRRKKQDVLRDLPDKIEEIRYARMEKKQQELYDGQVIRMKKKIAESSDSELKTSKIEILAELTKLRQICCDPNLFAENYRSTSAKTDMCLDLLKSLIDGGHRTLLFSQFTSMLDILKERLKEENIPYYEITGSTPKQKRVELVNAFNSGDIPVFLISLKAGGTGLNLTGADSVIHYDPWWNLAVEDQATGRAHRIGQTHTVTVYKLIVKGTIEENIVKMQEAKKKLSDDIIGTEGVSTTVLDRNELMELLGV